MELLSLVATLVAFLSLPAHAGDVGVRVIEVAAAERHQDLHVMIWYPAAGGGTPTLVGDNRLFKGTPALRDAVLASGRHPLVLVSHGSGGRIEGLAWIATRLAQAGFIVAGPNHPGTTSGDSTPSATPKLWERTGDLATLLTALTTDPLWRNAIREDRVGVLGFRSAARPRWKSPGRRPTAKPTRIIATRIRA